MKATLDLVATSDARRLLSVTAHEPAAPCATLLLVKCQTPTSLLIRVVIFRSTGVWRALSQWRRAHFAKCAVKIGIVHLATFIFLIILATLYRELSLTAAMDYFPVVLVI